MYRVLTQTIFKNDFAFSLLIHNIFQLLEEILSSIFYLSTLEIYFMKGSSNDRADEKGYIISRYPPHCPHQRNV
jgi:hypothetical protein